MNRKKGKLKFFRSEAAWVIFTSSKEYIRVHRDNIVDFGLKKNGHYYRSCYHFNIFGELSIWMYEQTFCLDKSCEYDILYEPVTKD